MSTGVTIVGTSLLAVLLAGYLAQKYLPAPTPKIVGIDLGTTFSSVGVYHAGTGVVEVLTDLQGRKSFPSIVAFLPNGSIAVSFDAVDIDLALYDAKRFIGKTFTPAELQSEASRYPFEVKLLDGGEAVFAVGTRVIRPEEVGAELIGHLVRMAQKQLNVAVSKAVISVPAEFDDFQRNATAKAANLAGVEVLRMINEPTAAALAYGLHKKVGVDHVIIVDLGGGTLDVSILLIQGGMFITRAMAGNNHLGGQDFTERLYSHVLTTLPTINDPHDLQRLRHAVEESKLALTYRETVELRVELRSRETALLTLDRATFERINADLFQKILRPIQAALDDVQLAKSDIDEIVLVGGSTRIPAVRRLISDYFGGKQPNFGVDPELAVVTGVAVQAGVISGGWPLQVSATELPARLRKIHVYD